MKTFSNVTRALVLLLSLCMLLSMLAACGSKGDEGEQTSGQGGTTATNALTDENGKLLDSLPTMNYGREFTILAVSGQRNHFYPPETRNDNVSKAVFSRNDTVEERMGVTFKWVLEPGQATKTEIANFIQKVETDYKGDCEFDSVISYNLTPYPLANRGLCLNLKDAKYIDLTGPWWPSVFLDRMLYKDQIFALVNSCGYGTLTNMTAIYFNNDLLESKSIESPYDLVEQNRWTADTLKTLIKDTYEDVNTDQKAGTEDLYGLCTSTAPRLTCWYVGFGARLSEVDGNGELQLTVADDKMGTVIDTIVDLFSTQDSCVVDKEQYVMFMDERAIFYLSTLTISTVMVRDGVEIDYGVAPIPKLNSAQDRYYTHIPNTHEAWFIHAGVQDQDCSSAFLECMASEAYRQVNDVFFETNLKLRYAPDDRLANMYDLVRESISFDFLYVYKNILAKDCDSYLRNAIEKPNKYNWSTSWAEIGTSVTTDFQKILDTYEMREGA